MHSPLSPGGGVFLDIEAGLRSSKPTTPVPVTPAPPPAARSRHNTSSSSGNSAARPPADFAAAAAQLQRQHAAFQQQLQQQAHHQPASHHHQLPSRASSRKKTTSPRPHSSSLSSSQRPLLSSGRDDSDSDPEDRGHGPRRSLRRRLRTGLRKLRRRPALLIFVALACLATFALWRSRLSDFAGDDDDSGSGVLSLDLGGGGGLSDRDLPSSVYSALMGGGAGGAAAGGGLAMPSSSIRAHVDLDPTLWRPSEDGEEERRRTNVTGAGAEDTAMRLQQLQRAGLQPSRHAWNFPDPLLRGPGPVPLAPFVDSTSSRTATSPPLTIFTTIRDLTSAYQRSNPAEYIKTWNALRSWRRLGTSKPAASAASASTEGEQQQQKSQPHRPPDVILFVDHGPETCAHLRNEKLLDMTGISCVSLPCFSSEFKKPLMSCIWRDALVLARTDLLVFLNGDVVLLDDFVEALGRAAGALDHFVMVAQRTDVPTMDWPKAKLNYFINVLPGPGDEAQGSSLLYEYPLHDESWLRSFRSHVSLRGKIHGDSGIDMFVFHRAVLEQFDLPDFLVGVFRWDNHVLAQMLARSANAPYDRIHGLKFQERANTNGTHQQRRLDGSVSRPPLSFLVIDATPAISLIHDSARSDHLRDLGAIYNDQLTRSKIGLRYKIGRIGNADLVMRVTPPPNDDPSSSTTPLERRVCTDGEDGSLCFLEWNNSVDRDRDRLDVHLVRQASPSGLVGVLEVSRDSTDLASNFLCWASQRPAAAGGTGGGAKNLIILAQDLDSYKVAQSWRIDVPVLLFPNATMYASSMDTTTSSTEVSAAQFALWRLQVLGRILDMGFSFLSLDPSSTIWVENPLPTLNNILATFQAQELLGGGHEDDRTHKYSRRSLAQQTEFKPIQVTQCSVLAITTKVMTSSSQETKSDDDDENPSSDDSDADASASAATTSTEILSSAFMLVTPNKYSRYLWRKVQECVAGVLVGRSQSHHHHHHQQREATRQVEDRCMHDLVGAMRRELDPATSDFIVCQMPRAFFLEHDRLRVPDQHGVQGDDGEDAEADADAETDDAATDSSNSNSTATKSSSYFALSKSVADWTHSNDPSSEMRFLGLSSRVGLGSSPAGDESGGEGGDGEDQPPAGLLPPLEEVLGLSSGGAYMHPKILHDDSHGGGAQAKIAKWKRAGLWCVFKPELMQAALYDPPLPQSSVPSSSVPRPAPAVDASPPMFLRIHVHVSPSPGVLTRDSFRTFLASLAQDASYPPQDTLDLEVDLNDFRNNPRELRRDRARKKKMAAAVTTASETPDVGAAAAVDDAEEDDEDDPDPESLTLSEAIAIFQSLEWKHGMKHLVAPVAPVPGLDSSTTPTTTSSMSAAAAQLLKLQPSAAASSVGSGSANIHDQLMAQAQADALRLRFRSEDWVVTYSFKDPPAGAGVAAAGAGAVGGSGGSADVPILLLTPSVRLGAGWFLFVKRQIQTYPKRHDEPSGIERRWAGISLMTLVDNVGEMEPTALTSEDDEVATSASAARQQPYPPASAMLARVSRSDPADIPHTDELRLLGDEYLHREGARYLAEGSWPPAMSSGTAKSAATDAAQVSGRTWSAIQRTQMVQPLALVIFSSTIQHINSWKRAKLNALLEADAAATARSNTNAAATRLESLPCWARPSFPTAASSSASTDDSDPDADAAAPPPPSYPHMSALLRYIFETGSFVTAPAPHALGGARLAREASFPASDEEGEAARTQQAVDAQLDVSAMFLPPSLGSVPLFDLSGASVPLPDTLPYRHLLLRAAHGAGAPPSSAAAATPFDLEQGCPWPAMHPKMEATFFVTQSSAPTSSED